MKLLSTTILLLSIFLAFSCGGNHLKADEKALRKRILLEEEQLALGAAKRSEREKYQADSIAKMPKGIRIKEERSVDPQALPIVVDIAGNLNNMRDFKLSQVASDIKYIRMETIPNPSISNGMKFKYYLMDNYIIAVNLFGIHQFSKEGKYICTVVQNEFTGLNYDKKKNQIINFEDYTKIGGGTSVSTKGDKLSYLYSNNITNQEYIMEYDCSSGQTTIADNTINTENPNRITGLGKVLFDRNQGTSLPPAPRSPYNSYVNTKEDVYKKLEVFAPDRNNYLLKMKGKYMMGILGSDGDTLATFTKYEKYKNLTNSKIRETDVGTRYEKGGNLFVRSEFNDTIFQVIPPNRILPVYVFHLAQYKTSMQEGVDASVSLVGKIILQDFADARNYLFFTFTKDSYDCPYTRRNKILKLYHAIFSKESRQMFIVDSKPTDYDAPILINDIDGGLPVWPDSYMIGKNGEILVPLQGEELKSHIQSDFFKTSVAQADKKEKLKQLAESVSSADEILMIVK